MQNSECRIGWVSDDGCCGGGSLRGVNVMNDVAICHGIAQNLKKEGIFRIESADYFVIPIAIGVPTDDVFI